MPSLTTKFLRAPEQLGEIRRLYEGDVLPVREIARRFEVAASTIYALRERENWPKRIQRTSIAALKSDGGYLCPGLKLCPERASVVAGLWAALEREVAEATAAIGGSDRTARARDLGVLTRALDKLVEFDRARLAARADDGKLATPETLDDLRRDLARRLDALERAGAPGNVSGEPERS
ncbi:hypothetical protein E8L99_13025 [Phreatobacter aquaticus]|uniref:Uncharacterized protein n=1 Tax=Phreatobacter aquaticus TaxID=2570229 RepID=A0A4D7QKV1_9HYPH|nr:hypothetical protein [Phreatobacter aquaticus]QCK86613.1 hypothetical protein E8L99_13025 [Phreatobacter aquaticus]